ncbi:MAG TPA: poly-beta-1,6-N-acetyl-D-glucosamine biosynthesis protein PgaD [Thermoanaerobaculia bacterium]|nr:poly-beta-1,6-N-acetyl-D-glucosamine biosynthesis protein PgaD [Thermoanaerobaculia bacterium]
MPSGEAPIGKPSTAKALLSRKWSKRRPLPAGLLSLLTVGFWAVWLYLVMPLVSLLLWAFGVRLFIQEIVADGFEGLRTSLVAYSSILLVLVGLLALWIGWNVVRYGGSHDRRTVKRAEATDQEVRQAFHLDESLLERMRTERLVRIDLDRDDCVVMIAAPSPQGLGSDAAGPDRLAVAQRDRDST